MNKATKARVRYNRWKRKMRLKHGPGWRAHRLSNVTVVPIHEPLPTKTVEELRLQVKRSQGIVPGAVQPAYTVGVSPNA
jgi:hypothetical protein